MQIGAVASYGVGFCGYSAKNSASQGQKNGLTVNKIIFNAGNSASGKAISPAKSFLQSLYEQKKSITETKNKLVADTLEQGKTLESIKPQLESYEEKLENVSEQIKQTLLQENQKGTREKQGLSQKEDTRESGTNDQAIYEEMHDILSASSSRARMTVINGAQNKMEGELKVISSEIKQDGFVSKSKASRMSKIREKLGDLQETLNSEKTETVKKQETAEDSIKQIIAKQDTLQSKINTYNQNVNPPAEQYPRALFNIMV